MPARAPERGSSTAAFIAAPSPVRTIFATTRGILERLTAHDRSPSPVRTSRDIARLVRIVLMPRPDMQWALGRCRHATGHVGGATTILLLRTTIPVNMKAVRCDA